MSRAKPPTVELSYCLACGCTEFSPCETDSGPCGWHVSPGASGRGLCSRCAMHYEDPKSLVTNLRAMLRP
jgi:hypothetical protein